jgi:hypothetical protein
MTGSTSNNRVNTIYTHSAACNWCWHLMLLQPVREALSLPEANLMLGFGLTLGIVS